MFGRQSERSTTEHHLTEGPLRARGGVYAGALATGIVVSQGAMLLLTAVIGAVLVALGVIDAQGGRLVVDGAAEGVALGTGIGLVIAQFFSYMWGGYTAARMSRGRGLTNGLLVPLFALVLFALLAGLGALVGADANVSGAPFGAGRLPFEGDLSVEWGIGAGIAFLAAMFLGGALGGILGQRWHRKLEDSVVERTVEERRATDATPDAEHARRDDHTIDLRDKERTRHEEHATAGAPGGEVREVGGHTYRSDQDSSRS